MKTDRQQVLLYRERQIEERWRSMEGLSILLFIFVPSFCFLSLCFLSQILPRRTAYSTWETGDFYQEEWRILSRKLAASTGKNVNFYCEEWRLLLWRMATSTRKNGDFYWEEQRILLGRIANSTGKNGDFYWEKQQIQPGKPAASTGKNSDFYWETSLIVLPHLSSYVLSPRLLFFSYFVSSPPSLLSYISSPPLLSSSPTPLSVLFPHSNTPPLFCLIPHSQLSLSHGGIQTSEDHWPLTDPTHSQQ